MDVNAQVVVQVSTRHLAKVNKQPNVSKKLALYRKYYKKDSIKSVRAAERFWQAKTDSLEDVIAQREKAVARKARGTRDGLHSKIYQVAYKPWAKKQAKAQLDWLGQQGIGISSTSRQILLRYFEDHFLLASQNDSLLTVLRIQMPSLHMPNQLASKAKDYQLINPNRTKSIRQVIGEKLDNTNPGNVARTLHGKMQQHATRVAKYSEYSGLLDNSDSLKYLAGVKGEEMAIHYISKADRYSDIGELKTYQREVDKLRGTTREHRDYAGPLQDSAYVRDQAKKKAEEMAMKYIAEHPEVMQGVQKKMGLLMRKYSVVPNSNDLSTAIKRTSLKGKPFRERLYFAANFQFISLGPVSIDFSPMGGYRFNKNFLAGAGLNYRQSFGDPIAVLSPDVFGYKGFASYDVFRNFFAYGEFDRNAAGGQNEGGFSSLNWKDAAFFGVGRKISIHPKLEMTMIFLYNFLHDYPDPVYPKKWNIRIGLQTSALALFKPKPTFN